MTEYKCGCDTDGLIVIEDNILGTAHYLEWVDSVGLNGTREQCFDCYNEGQTELKSKVKEVKSWE